MVILNETWLTSPILYHTRMPQRREFFYSVGLTESDNLSLTVKFFLIIVTRFLEETGHLSHIHMILLTPKHLD